MKWVFAFLAFTILAACTQQPSSPQPSPIVAAGCSLESIAANSIAQEIIKQETCAAPISLIQNDLLGLLGKANLCSMAVPKKMAYKGIIGDAICPAAIASLNATFLKPVPATWQCSGNVASGTILASLQQACQNAISF